MNSWLKAYELNGPSSVKARGSKFMKKMKYEKTVKNTTERRTHYIIGGRRNTKRVKRRGADGRTDARVDWRSEGRRMKKVGEEAEAE